MQLLRAALDLLTLYPQKIRSYVVFLELNFFGQKNGVQIAPKFGFLQFASNNVALYFISCLEDDFYRSNSSTTYKY